MNTTHITYDSIIKLRGSEKAEGTMDTSTWSWWEIKRFCLKLVFQKKKLMCYWSYIGDPTIQKQKLYSSKTKKRNSENIIFQVVTPHFAWSYSLFCLLIISTKKYKFCLFLFLTGKIGFKRNELDACNSETFNLVLQRSTANLFITKCPLNCHLLLHHNYTYITSYCPGSNRSLICFSFVRSGIIKFKIGHRWYWITLATL